MAIEELAHREEGGPDGRTAAAGKITSTGEAGTVEDMGATGRTASATRITNGGTTAVISGRGLSDDTNQRRVIYNGDWPRVQETRHAALHFRPERDRNAEEEPMRAASNAGPIAMLKRPAPVAIHDGELAGTKVARTVSISRAGAGADATAGTGATAAATLRKATAEAAVHRMAETSQVGAAQTAGPIAAAEVSSMAAGAPTRGEAVEKGAKSDAGNGNAAEAPVEAVVMRVRPPRAAVTGVGPTRPAN